jgi:lactam utilization protein B
MGANLHHVKPHGALYNMAVKDRELAKAIVTSSFRHRQKPRFLWFAKKFYDLGGRISRLKNCL